jgi:putative protease
MIANNIELLAPAGGFEQLSAALNAGADAVYFGVGKLNMRSGAAVNFTIEDLPEIVERCHAANAKAYLTVNTVVYDWEIEELYKLCDAAKAAKVDACIAGDIAVISYLRKINMSVHITVQCNVCNMEAVRFYAQFADVMVLARELPLEAVAHIIETIKQEDLRGPSGNLVKIEIFAHGALCVAISGKCYMSLCTYNRSANRGQCLQNCRRKYKVVDESTGAELVIDNNFVMSPKDICTIDFLDKILDSGVSVLKIEGRGRSADYVKTTIEVYREAVDACKAGTFSKDAVPAWKARLSEVFNRGFWEGGYYLGKKLDEWCNAEGSLATIVKRYIGKVTNYYPRIQVAQVKLEACKMPPESRVLITGNVTGALDFTLGEMQIDGTVVSEAPQGSEITFKLADRVRVGDKVYLLLDRDDELNISKPTWQPPEK